MYIQNTILLILAIFFHSTECQGSRSPAGTIEVIEAYVNKVKYKHTHPSDLSTVFCDIKSINRGRETQMTCFVENQETTDCYCQEGFLTKLNPDTEYTVNVRKKNHLSEILTQGKIKTAAKTTFKSEIIYGSYYEYEAELPKGKTLPYNCNVCLEKGKSTNQCCTGERVYTAQDHCTKGKFENLEPFTDYEFFICDTQGGPVMKRQIKTTGIPKKFNVVFSENEVSYQINYTGSNTIPTGPCVGSFVGKGSATCKGGQTCDCARGVFILPADKDNLRFQLKIKDGILVDYTPDGPGAENPNYFVGSLKGHKLTTSEYTISSKEGDLGQLVCNFYASDGSEVKCQSEGDNKTTDCKCASGKLVELSPNTDYTINVVLRDTKEKIISGLKLRTAEIGTIMKEAFGLNKYKYEVKYSDETGSNKPDDCRVCLLDPAIKAQCCTDDYFTHSDHCSSYEFTVVDTKPRSLKLKICDTDGSFMLSKDVEMVVPPTSSIIILYEDQIRYKMIYKNNNIPSSCKFFINDVEKSDLHCTSNMPCDCEKGAFNYTTDDKKFKFTIKDMAGVPIASQELDKSKKDEYLSNVDAACSTFGI